jgi:glucans biosynthesis protein
MLGSPRCGARARTRNRQPCRSPAVKGKRRCRMHGGKNEGGKIGNRNALRHGRYRPAVLRERRELRDFVRWCDRLLAALALTAG